MPALRIEVAQIRPGVWEVRSGDIAGSTTHTSHNIISVVQEILFLLEQYEVKLRESEVEK